MTSKTIEDAREIAISIGIKALVSSNPFTKTIYEAFEEYRRKREKEALEEFQNYVMEKIGDQQQVFSDPWLQSEIGKQFWEKIFCAAIDAQAAGKRQHFANALIGGVTNKGITDADKLRFVDVLRQISIPALYVLAALFKKYGDTDRFVEGSGIVKDLMLPIDPFTVESTFKEMEGLGLFSPTTQFSSTPSGYLAAGYSGGAAYNPYTRRFIEFVVNEPKIKS